MENEEFETNLLLMVAHAGDANSKVYDALDMYEKGHADKAYQLLDEAQVALLIAHKSQFELLNKEANGEKIIPSVIMIHAMDICMTAANSIQYTRRLISLMESRK